MITDVTRRSLFEKLYDECKDNRDFQSFEKMANNSYLHCIINIIYEYSSSFV